MLACLAAAFHIAAQDEQTIDLVAITPQQREKWVEGLTQVMTSSVLSFFIFYRK
jgi:hypothetical protein